MDKNFIPYGLRKDEIFDKSREDNRVCRFLTPTRIVWTNHGDGAIITNENKLLRDVNPQMHLFADDLCIMESKNKPASIVLDFGVEFQGRIKILLKDTTAQRVNLRIRFGESVMETMEDKLYAEKNAVNDHINRDIVINSGNLSGNEVGPTGFRFVRIDLLDLNTAIGLIGVKGMAYYRELEYKGSFVSDDERLNKIWNTGAYTMHLNMQEYVWDGIKRDRLVWIEDMHPETSTIQAVFGSDPSVEASLELAKDETPLPKVMNDISSYSVWWVCILHDWYMHNGNREFLEKQKDYLLGLLGVLTSFVDRETGKEIMPPMRFIDWPTYGDENIVHAGLQGILTWGLSKGAFLARELGDEDMAQNCEAAVACLRSHVPATHGNKSAAALLSLSGIADPYEMNKIIEVDGAHGLSTFLGYYVLQAMAKADNVEGALEYISTYWGAMIDRGATTFWEDFNLDWLDGSGRIDELVPPGVKDLYGDYGAYCYTGFRHSLCHGWASGPTPFLSEYVLGFKPVEPGCKKLALNPNLGHLNFVEGSYPTPYGTVKVRHEKQEDGSIKTEILEKPEEVEIVQ